MLEHLKDIVFRANLELVKQGLVIYTWGNVSAFDQETGYVVIKPSGVAYETMQAEDMVVVDLEGNIIEGDYRPSSDTPTHCYLYRVFPQLGSVVHTHSSWATMFAQAKRSIQPYGTTHADYFYGEIPCTRPLRDDEIAEAYEHHTGCVIEETFKQLRLDPLTVPSVLVSEHGPFSFGSSPETAVHNAKVLEEVAKMAYHTEVLNPNIRSLNPALLNKHYLRKHGKNAYYGQK